MDESGNTPLHWACRNGHIEVVNLLIANGANPNKINFFGDAPLYWAAKEGNIEIVKALILQKINVNNRNIFGNTALSWACIEEHKEVVDLLIKNGADVNIRNNNRQTVLHNAVYKKNLDIANLILEKDPETDVVNRDGMTPLLMAVQNKDIKMCQLLVEKNASVKEIELSTSIELNEKIYDLLKAKNEEIKIIDSFENLSKKYEELVSSAIDHPTSLKSIENLIKFMNRLANQDLRLELKTRDGSNIFHVAARLGNLDLAKQVVFPINSSVFDAINAYDNKGRTPLLIAAWHHHTDIVKFFLYNNAEPLFQYLEESNSKTWFPLVWAGLYAEDYTPELQFRRHKGIGFSKGPIYGETPLHWATMYAHSATVRFLIENGYVDKNVQSDFGWTPLHLAAQYGHVEIMQFLLDKGADVRVQDNLKRMPIHVAAQYGQFDCVELLLKEDIQTVNKTVGKDFLDQVECASGTPLHQACKYGHHKVAILFINNGVDLTIKNANGRDPIEEARYFDHHDLADQLECFYQKGHELLALFENKNWEKAHSFLNTNALLYVNARNSNRATPLHIAASEGKDELLSLLIEKGAYLFSKDNDGRTPIAISYVSCKYEFTRRLLYYGSKLIPQELEKEALTGIHEAVENNNVSEVVSEIGRDSESINSLTRSGLSPLMLAAVQGNETIVNLLLESGAKVEQTNERGETALIWASAFQGREKIVESLLAQGAHPNCQSQLGMTPLHWAALEGNNGIASVLLKNRAKPDVGDILGFSPLYIACRQGHISLIKELLNYRANPFKQNKLNSKTPFRILEERSQDIRSDKRADWSAIANRMNAHFSPGDKIFLESKEKAIDNGTQEITSIKRVFTRASYHNFFMILLKIKGLNSCKISLSTVPIKAFEKYYASHVGKGSDVYTYCVKEERLLLIEAEISLLKVLINFLEKNGSKIDWKQCVDPRSQWTLLHLAAYWGNKSLCKHLIAKGHQVNLADSLGRTPVYMAAFWKHRPVLTLMDGGYIEESRDIFKERYKWDYTYWSGLTKQKLSPKKMLEQEGSHLLQAGPNTEMRMHNAAYYSEYKLFVFLIKELEEANGKEEALVIINGKGANTHKYGWSFLHQSVSGMYREGTEDERNAQELVKYLLDKGANPNITDFVLNRSPLLVAIQRDAWSCAKILISNENTDLNLKDSQGKTSLHYAVEKNRLDLVKDLHENKAIDQCDKKGRFPIDLANQYEFSEIIDYYHQKTSEVPSEKKPYTPKIRKIAGSELNVIDDYWGSC